MKSNHIAIALACMAAIPSLLTSCRTHPQPEPQVEIVYVVNTPGENLNALSKVTEGDYRCEQPYGGDNGKNLYFVAYSRASQTSNIYKKDNTFSASMIQKTSGNNRNVSPTYCNANDMMAFAGKFGTATIRDLYMINGNQGNALIQVTNTPDAEENYPCLSKDGKRIVYEMRSVAANATDTEIWTKNLQTNEKTMLGTGRMPSYSPDGSSIVYVKYTEDGWNTTLWIMNLSSGSQTQVTDANMGVVWNPRFSPDGRKIIFQCAKQQKKDFDLYTIDTNGNNLTQLTINESYDGEPYWTSDGYIYFTSDRGGRDGNYQIWRFKVKEGPIPPPVDYHIVKSGENINQIANRYHVTVKDLVKENGLSTMTLTPGQKLRIPSSR